MAGRWRSVITFLGVAAAWAVALGSGWLVAFGSAGWRAQWPMWLALQALALAALWLRAQRSWQRPAELAHQRLTQLHPRGPWPRRAAGTRAEWAVELLDQLNRHWQVQHAGLSEQVLDGSQSAQALALELERALTAQDKLLTTLQGVGQQWTALLEELSFQAELARPHSRLVQAQSHGAGALQALTELAQWVQRTQFRAQQVTGLLNSQLVLARQAHDLAETALSDATRGPQRRASLLSLQALARQIGAQVEQLGAALQGQEPPVGALGDRFRSTQSRLNDTSLTLGELGADLHEELMRLQDIGMRMQTLSMDSTAHEALAAEVRAHLLRGRQCLNFLLAAEPEPVRARPTKPGTWRARASGPATPETAARRAARNNRSANAPGTDAPSPRSSTRAARSGKTPYRGVERRRTPRPPR